MIATYRLQLLPDFGFDEVRALVPYFSRLGVSHLYLSPITESVAGSTHGYDVIDHNVIRRELGGREAFEALLEAVEEAGLQLILDFVPNHAGVGSHNAFWQDVLAFGPHSPSAGFFDIDWRPLKERLQGKVLLPFLGSPYGAALDAGEIRLAYEDGRFYATYFDNRFALNPATYTDVLADLLPRYERTDVYWDLKDLADAYAGLEAGEYQKAQVLRARLRTLAGSVALEEPLSAIRGDRLHALLEKQYWRLAYWKTAGHEINYRRFFDINGLVALRMEDGEVFWNAHRLLGDLLARRGFAGVRIDHVDGLFDPQGYLDRLRDLGAQQIWVEKILALGETMPPAWPVEGTTGYEFMNDVMGVLLQPEGEPSLDRVYRRFVPEAESYDDEAHASKMLVMETALSSELFRLGYQLNRLSEADYHTRDFTLESLRRALAELVAAFGRYRTYLPYEEEEAQKVLQEAAAKARRRNPAFEPSVYDFITDLLLGKVREDLHDQQQALAGRFQQYTAPVAAKGIEDTTFYRYLRLVALNEVGGEPDHFGQSPQAFHAHNRFRGQRYPRNLLATATHDHKRGEDTRMRLIVLAEAAELWEETVRALSEVGQAYRRTQGPSRADEYLFFQTVAALWRGSEPEALAERLWPYLQKASRESKRHTSWNDPNAAYEEALEAFVRGVLGDARTASVLDRLAGTLARHGFSNTLSQVVLKFTSVGVPDLYQGTELLDLSLVDPDNRRPVDYERRLRLLDEMDGPLGQPDAAWLQALVAEGDERAKFFFTARLLRLRGEHPDLFTVGGYRPLEPGGPHAAHWIAYAREHEGRVALVLAPRFPTTLPEAPDASVPLPQEWARFRWRDALTGTEVEPAAAIDAGAFPLPWAVLVRVE